MANGTNMRSVIDGVAMLSFVVGLICLSIGVGIGDQHGEDPDWISALDTLPSPKSADAGATVVVAGRIAADTAPLRDDFIAFHRTQYKCPTPGELRCIHEDVVVETARQPFTMVTDEGTVRIENEDYRFDDTVAGWAAVERQEEAPAVFSGAKTIRGFVAESPVVVVGQLEAGPPSPAVRAGSIIAGPPDDLRRRLTTSAERRVSSGYSFTLIGVLLLGFSGWYGWRTFKAKN